ncbi:MAG: DJ-1/PfpI family protein [Pseudomonadota bacterium]
MAGIGINVVLFEEFEVLDVFGPLSFFGMLPETFSCQLTSIGGGMIASSAGPRVETAALDTSKLKDNWLVVPGGRGTRALVQDANFLAALSEASAATSRVLTICTGSGLLAAAGGLDGKKATSNKLAWDWATAQSDKVNWVRQARWVTDGKFTSSSGVSAGMDAALALIAQSQSIEMARQVARWGEYRWNEDCNVDEFA